MIEEKKSFISCNCKSNLSFYPFLLPIIFMAIRYTHDEIFELYKPSMSFKLLRYNLPYLFYFFLSKVFAIMLIRIIKLNIKSKADPNQNNVILKNYNIIKGKRKKFLLFIYIISFLEVICEHGNSLLYYYQKIRLSEGKGDYELGWLIEKKTIYIIFVPIFSYFMLDKKLYSHHILALIIGFIGACIINVCRFPLGFSKIDKYPYHLINLFLSSLLSFALVLTKYVMNSFLFLSPYIFLFYDGIFCIINSFIYTVLSYFLVINLPNLNTEIDEEKENQNYFRNNFIGIFTFFNGQEPQFYIYFFISLILSFIYYVINILTIYDFSPFLFIIIETLLPIDDDFIFLIFQNRDDIIEKKDKIIKRTIIQSIGYIILFVGALIINEIIILNFCGFDENIFDKICKRGRIDLIPLNQTEDKGLEDDISIEEVKSN